jgi:hypothetical protein
MTIPRSGDVRRITPVGERFLAFLIEYRRD